MFNKKDMNMIVAVISLLIFVWIIMYAVPSLFVNLFNTYLGISILLGLVILMGIYNKNMAIGIALLFVILYQFAHMTPKGNSNTNTNTNTNTN